MIESIQNYVLHKPKKQPSKLTFGIGINDVDYMCDIRKTVNGKSVQVWLCPFYNKWKKMLERVYSEAYLSKKPSYKEANVCSYWLKLSNFKAWMSTQLYDGLELDKDILIKGNKEYNPDCCCFVPRKLNTCLSIGSSRFAKADLPLGVVHKGVKFIAQIYNNGTIERLGIYPTSNEAHRAWQWERAVKIEQVIAWYATQDCFRTDIAEALTQRVWNLRLDHSLYKTTEDL